MKLYDFSRLIRKYSVTFYLRKMAAGKYVSGKWVDGAPIDQKMEGAIVPISDRKLYGSGGTFTSKDRELYLMEPITGDLNEFKVIYNGDEYSIEAGKNFEDYANVAVYNLKWVSKAVEKND